MLFLQLETVRFFFCDKRNHNSYVLLPRDSLHYPVGSFVLVNDAVNMETK
jgi:hypothetical protein